METATRSPMVSSQGRFNSGQESGYGGSCMHAPMGIGLQARFFIRFLSFINALCSIHRLSGTLKAELNPVCSWTFVLNLAALPLQTVSRRAESRARGR